MHNFCINKSIVFKKKSICFKYFNELCNQIKEKNKQKII